MGFKSFAKFGKLKTKFEVCYFGKKKKKNQNKCKGFIINIQSNTKYQEKKKHLNCHKLFLEKAHNTLEYEPYV